MALFEEAGDLKNRICIMMCNVFTLFPTLGESNTFFSIYGMCRTVRSVCINEGNLENVCCTSNDFSMNISQVEWSYNTNIARVQN